MIGNTLEKFVGYMVAINATDPEKLQTCGLKSISDDHFSVVTQKGLLIHIPYSRILSIVEDNEGGTLNIGSTFNKATARVVVHIEHMIIYKGSTGFGFQVPV
jgi:hypothetical protein